ncbi:NACHT domain-containing protein [Streptomyces sp. NPDC002514]|uniref:NACHT domain-containing protein n=1 Tax=Streptomyces sp. NPDC001270 TaxID=3364554 RepID=UPI0036782B15
MSTADGSASGAPGPDELDVRRVVQVVITRRGGEEWRGSGYRVSGNAVLTAAHVVRGAVSVTLRFLTEDGDVTELSGEPEPLWEDSDVDVAVLKISNDPGGSGLYAAEVPPVRYGLITQPVDCDALGFPKFKLRPDNASSELNRTARYRDSHHAQGKTTPWADLRKGTLEISVGAPGPDPEGRSPWEGMSGAAVWSGGYLIGVVSAHHLTDGAGRLTASRVQRWYKHLTQAQIDQLGYLIGLPARAVHLTRLPPPPPHPPPAEGDPAEALADEVSKQWRKEEEQRRVHDPFPLPVRFRCTDRNVFDNWANIRRLPRGAAATPLPLDGELDQIVDAYTFVPSGRLVVLGEAGSGKSILTLRFLVDWLDTRTPGDRVPVIFGLGSWDPAATSLRDWMCAQLVRDHPFLAAPAARGGNLARVLVDSGRILPVLDGFDEIPSGLHGMALKALNQATTMPLLLTSRPDEYTKAVNGSEDSDVLTAAAVIELEDLMVDDYAHYLIRASRTIREGGADRTVWDGVLARLREGPYTQGTANLAKVLATPLMVSLARTIYSDAPRRDPEKLLDFPTPEALQDHLLDAFIPAVYSAAPHDDRDADSPRHRRHWTPGQAQHWLGYLAAHLEKLKTHDLGWWQLGTTMRRSTRMLVIGFLAGMALGVPTGIGNLPVDLIATTRGLGFAIVRGLLVCLLHGLVAGLVFALVYEFAPRGAAAKPSTLRIQIFGETRRNGAEIARRFILGIGFGAPTAVVLVLMDRLIVGPLGFDDGLDGGLRGALLFPVEIGFGAGTALAVMAWLETPIDTTSAISASDLLRTNRKNAFVHMLVWLLVLGVPAGIAMGFAPGRLGGFAPGPVLGLLVGLVFGIEGAFAGGLGYGLSFTAWGQWAALSRMWLPLTRRLPWAVIAFLDDAHDRGVLRKAGAVYQFRHARLEAHLAHVHRARQDSTGRGVHPVGKPGTMGERTSVAMDTAISDRR